MPKCKEQGRNYNDWIRTMSSMPSVKERILEMVRERSRAAFEADDMSLAPTVQDLVNAVGGTKGRVYQQLDSLRNDSVEPLVRCLPDEKCGHIKRWFATDKSGMG